MVKPTWTKKKNSSRWVRVEITLDSMRSAKSSCVKRFKLLTSSSASSFSNFCSGIHANIYFENA